MTISAKPSSAAKALRRAIRAKRPLCMWGAPGIGKSQVVQQVAAELGMGCQDVRAVLLDPVDLRGLPVVVDGKAVWAIPGFLPQPDDGPTVLFLDEITRAPMLVQNALFQLVLDRKLGEYTLPDDCVVVAASNREGDGGGITRMNPALANRFVHVNVEPDLDDWSRWAVTHEVEPVVIAFLRFKPTLLHDFQRDAHAFPTPRSWEFVSDVVKESDGDAETERLLVSGAVGEGAAVEFLSFIQLYRSLPNIDAILLDPAHAPVPDDMATLYAASSALAARAKVDNFGRILTYLDRLPGEFAVFAVRDSVMRDGALDKTPEFTKWAVQNADLL